MTICNMTIEGGARAGLIAPDEKIFNYLKGKPMSPKGDNWEKALNYWSTLRTDTDASFDQDLIKSPAYSITEPVPPAVPIFPII